MSEDKGWIKLHRNSFNNDLYFSEPFTKWQAWCDLLLLANHKKGVLVKRGVIVDVPRGSIGYGTENLAKRWKWSRGKTERFMCFLEGNLVQQIVRQKTRITTLISIINYETYQTNSTTDSKTNSTTNGHQTVQQTDTNKNVKEEKEVTRINTLVKPIHEKFEKNGNIRSIENYASGADVLAERILKDRAKVKQGGTGGI